jgi:hypothetical protein
VRCLFVEIVGFDWRFLGMDGCLSWGRLQSLVSFGLGSRWRQGTHRFGDMVATDIVV